MKREIGEGPSLNVFIRWLQQVQNEDYGRLIQLRDGQNPVQRDARYVRVDRNIVAAKEQFLQRRQNVQVNGGFQMLLHEIQHYLEHVKHLLGGQ